MEKEAGMAALQGWEENIVRREGKPAGRFGQSMPRFFDKF
jgi:hypothetical protein